MESDVEFCRGSKNVKVITSQAAMHTAVEVTVSTSHAKRRQERAEVVLVVSLAFGWLSRGYVQQTEVICRRGAISRCEGVAVSFCAVLCILLAA